MKPLTVTVGKTYLSKCFNQVKIIGKRFLETKDGPDFVAFEGVLCKVKPDHEVLKGKVHLFDVNGRWVKNGKFVNHAIHDLKEVLP